MDEIAEKVHGRYPVLFLGSGFSSEAKNSKGKSLPTGRGLANILASRIGLPENKYELDVISREFKNSEETNGGEYNLFNLLNEVLEISEYSENQANVLNLPWKRIYTTNYDNVVEKIFADKKKKFAPVNLLDSNEINKNEVNKNTVEIVHLNGHLSGVEFSDFDRKIRLTKASYASTEFFKSNWYSKFSSDLSFCSCFIVIGYSVYDLDIARVLYSDPHLMRKTYFIEAEGLDPVFKRELEQYGTVLPIGLKDFATAMSKENLTTPLNSELSFIEPITFSNKSELPTGTDVRNLIFDGDYDQSKFELSKKSDDLYAIDREAVKRIEEYIKTGKNRVIVSADLGNGKSILVDQLAYGLEQSNYLCYRLPDGTSLLENDLQILHDQSDGRTVLFVEDLFAKASLVSSILNFVPNIIIVGTSRSAIIELNETIIQSLFGEDYLFIDINKLTSPEIEQVIVLMDQNGLWGDQSHLTYEKKKRYLSGNLNSEIRDIITQIYDSSHLKEKLIKEFSKQNNYSALKVIVTALMLRLINLEPDLSLLKSLTDLDAYADRKLINNVFSLEFIESKHGKIRIKSTIFGRYLLKNVVDQDYLLNNVVEIIKRCDELSTGWESQHHKMLKSFTRYSFVNQIFNEKTSHKTYLLFYDKLKTLPSLSRDPQFWLQYAIAQTQVQKYPDAQISFETAKSFARNRSENVKRMIENHYAKFLLNSRIHSARYSDKFVAFEKAHTTLITHARNEKDRYYAYNAAQLYNEYYHSFFKTFSQKEKDFFYDACIEMCDEAEKVSSVAQKYFIVQICIQKLNEIIVKIESSFKK